MSIDSTIGPIKANGNYLSSIFYQIINKFKVSNPITSEIVELSTNGELLGSIEDVVLWESDFYSYLTTGVDVYLQMKFPGRYLHQKDSDTCDGLLFHVPVMEVGLLHPEWMFMERFRKLK